MVTVGLYVLLIVGVGLERLYELRLSQVNLASVKSRGGFLVEEREYPWIAGMHCLFLASCVLEVVFLERDFPGALGWVAFGVAILAQGLRHWAARSLGDRWNVRIVVVPGEPLVTTGPYRWLTHPNYLAVTLEIATLPLVHGGIITALVFSLANAFLLPRRIAREESALALRAQRGGMC